MLLDQIKNYEIFRPKCDHSKEILHSGAPWSYELNPGLVYISY